MYYFDFVIQILIVILILPLNIVLLVRIQLL